MQSLSWYYRRLRAMSMDEVLWRVKSSLGTTRDRYRLSSLMKRAAANAAYANEKLAQSRPEARITFPESLAHASTHPKFIADNLPERADRILAGQISLLGNIVVDCGPRIDWNYDYQNKIASPSGYSPKIDYRDVREAGDAKWVWEPSRHQHFVVLARQYALTGEREYLHTIVDHWTGWLDQCPFQVGMQWRSPLELGIRLINWSLTWELVDGARNFDSAFRARVLQAIDLHLYDITAKYSRGSSANNHLVGEAAGVLVAAAVFPAFPYTTERFETARSILEREIELQILPDGSNAEFTTGYHVFVLQFFTVAGLVARRAGRDFGAGYWERLKKGYAYLAALHEAGGPMPMFNDADDGFVVDLDHHPRDPKPWLTVGAVLFDSPAWLPEKIHGEAAYWLLGAQQTAAVLNKKPAHESRQLKSRAFSDAGHYLLQTGKTDEDNISVVFDCGPLGFGSIAAHGHADALSFTLRANGRELLTDPGTYDYFTHRAWRDHLRTTAAHNTVVVDNTDQSEMLGLFLWGRRANAVCTEFLPDAPRPRIAAQHDGYMRLADPVRHQRTLTLDPGLRRIVIEDLLDCVGNHEVALYFHCAESCTVKKIAERAYRLDADVVIATFQMDERLTTSLFHGSETTKLGWVSRGYHVRSAASTLVATGTIQGTTLFRTEIVLDETTDSISLHERKQTVGTTVAD